MISPGPLDALVAPEEEDDAAFVLAEHAEGAREDGEHDDDDDACEYAHDVFPLGS